MPRYGTAIPFAGRYVAGGLGGGCTSQKRSFWQEQNSVGFAVPPQETHRRHVLAQNKRKRFCAKRSKHGGGDRSRTDDLLLAKQLLYQLSYTPNMLRGYDGGPGKT